MFIVAEFHVVKRGSGRRLASRSDIADHIEDLLLRLDAIDGGQCVVRLEGGRLHGRAKSQRIDDIDPDTEENMEIVWNGKLYKKKLYHARSLKKSFI